MNPFISIAVDGALLAMLIVLTSEPASPEAAKADIAKADAMHIQGTWKVVALEAAGVQAPAEIVAALKLNFKDDTLTFEPAEPGFARFTFKLDPTAKPPAFDMIPLDVKGEAQQGIYALEGDDLKICLGGAD